MFTIQCTTCNAKLSVRNEELIGQILACPKCGGMVLVQPPEENVVPVIFKKFPDLLTSETASGIIGAVPEHLEPLEQLNPPTPPPIPLSETELRTRKMLLSILAGLFLFLIVAVGVLIVVKGNRSDEIPVNPVKQSDIDQPTIEQPATEQAAAEQPEIAQPVPVPSTEVAKPQEKTTPEVAHAQTETPTTEKSTTETPSTPTTTIPTAETATVSSLTEDDDGTRLAALLDKTPKEPEIRSTTDLLSDLEKKMPGLVPPLAFSLDIPTRLAIPLTGLKLDKTPLLKVIRLLSDLTEIPMTFDMEEMRPRGIQIDAPLTAQFDAGNVGDILSKILATFELEPVIEDRQILITVSPERRNTLSERTFDVADLVENTKNSADPLTPEHLAEILQRLVDPTNDAFIRVEGQSLIIQNRFRLLDESLRVLEQLRVIRKLSQKTDVVGEFLAPEAFGWD
ncbi:MAG: hypothetical protein LBQ50_03325, partial [Planctomycetaceae bacterium]|nr:hypothetical protein [Planctomycetaceae bacterium]